MENWFWVERAQSFLDGRNFCWISLKWDQVLMFIESGNEADYYNFRYNTKDLFFHQFMIG